MEHLLFLLLGVLILLSITFFISKFDIFDPSFIACAMFFISTVFAIYAKIAWNVSDSFFSYKAVMIILSGLLVFIISCQIAKYASFPAAKKIINNNEKPKIIKISQFKLFLALMICAVSILLYVQFFYKYVQQNGYKEGFDLVKIGKFYHNLTFLSSKEGSIPWFIRLMLQIVNAMMYVCMYIFLYNTILCRDSVITNSAYLLPIVFWIPRVIVASSRTNLIKLAGFAIFIIYIMMNRRNNWKKKQRNYGKIFIISVTSLLVVLLAFYFVITSGIIGRNTNKNLIDYIAVYIGAPIIHFNQFIKSPPPDVSYFGQETFAGLNGTLYKRGLVNKQVSTQLEIRKITKNYSGNVYTFFRRPLHDFGLLGMYIVTFITGILFSYVYYKKIFKSVSSYKTDLIMIFYGYFFYIIYMFSIMNNYCNDISTANLFFLLAVFAVYSVMLGGIVLRLPSKILIRKL